MKIFSAMLLCLSVSAHGAESQQMREMQDKINALEQKVNALNGEVKAKSVEAPAAAKSDKPGLAYKGISIQFGGFLASETVYRNNNMENDIGSSFVKLPFDSSLAKGQSEFRGSERQSRLSILAQGTTDSGTLLSGYYELDFLGTSPTATPAQSNSFTPRTRNVYFAADFDSGLHLLAGQNWSMVTLNNKGIVPRTEAIPMTVDAQYIAGFSFARQWQMRVVKDFDKMYWVGLSLENAQTLPTSGNPAANTGNTSSFNSGNLLSTNDGGTSMRSINAYPDIVLKGAVDTHFGHFELYGLARNFQSHFGGTTAITQTQKQDVWTEAVGAGVIVPILPQMLDISLSGLYGKGIGRYGTSQIADVTYAADGSLSPLSGSQYVAQVIGHAMGNLDAYVGYGFEQVNNDLDGGAGYGSGVVATNSGCNTLGGACTPEVHTINQLNIGGWWTFFKGDYGVAKLGVQYSRTNLYTFADRSGFAPSTSEDMIFTSLRYYPF